MSKKRIYGNFIASTGYQILTLLVGLIVPKYYTEVFGSVYNGLNSSIMQIMSLLHVLTLGIAAISVQQMFKYIAANDNEMITAIYQSTAKQYRQMGFVFLAVLVPIIVLFPFAIHDKLSYGLVVAFLLLRGVSSALEYFFQAKYSVVLIAQNRSYAIYTINIILTLIGAVLHLAVLFSIKHIIVYQTVAVFLALLRLTIIQTYVNRKLPFLRQPTEKKYEPPEDIRRRDTLVSEIAGLIIDSTDLVVLGTFAGLVYASIYSVYNFVIVGLANVLASCREAVFAGIGKTYFQDFGGFQRKMSHFESVYIAMVFFLYSTCILLFRPFIEIYTAKMDTNYVFTYFPILFVVSKMLVNLRIPSIVAINTAGHFKQVKKYAVIEAIINLSISLVLVKPFGIYGVLAGTIVGAAYRTPILIFYASRKIMRRSVWAYVGKILRWVPLLGMCFGLSLYMPIHCSSLVHWTGIAIVCSTVMVGVCIGWMQVADREAFEEFQSMLKGLGKKFNLNVNIFA